MTTTYTLTLKDVELFAKAGNINAVEAFLKSEIAKEYELSTLQHVRACS